jgi:hypothetical protein
LKNTSVPYDVRDLMCIEDNNLSWLLLNLKKIILDTKALHSNFIFFWKWPLGLKSYILTSMKLVYIFMKKRTKNWQFL